MMDERDIDYSKLRIVIISLLVFLVSVIILCFSISSHSSSAAIIFNYDPKDSKTKSLLSNEELENLKKLIASVAKSNYGYSGNPQAAIRWSSFRTRGNIKQYLVDIDAIKQTFSVSQFNGIPEITCPDLSETGYPDSYCYSYEDSTDTLGKLEYAHKIPYSGKTRGGVEFILSKSSSDVRTLIVSVHKLNATESEKREAIEAARSYIVSLGGGHNLFDFEARQASMNGMGE